jgi:excinuclease UvrABC ATPase subunit
MLEVRQAPEDAWNTVVVSEHLPDVIRIADWEMALGPRDGDESRPRMARG